MNRKILLCILLLSFATASHAQFGNEWINFSQEYYKIATAKDGLYRLTFTDLQSAGVPVSAINPQNIQIFHRGVEQSIYVAGQGDGSFDNADFIEFYGRKNDGTLDQDLYSAGNQPHPYHNLFSDSTYYFLTVGASTGKRVIEFFENNTTSIPLEVAHQDEKLLVNANQYAFGYLENSYLSHTIFDQGEGWTGTEIRQNQFQNYTISNIINGVQSAGLPTVEILLVGRGSMAHVAEISVGPSTGSLRSLGTINFTGFETSTFNQNLSWTDIAADGTLIVQVKALGAGAADRLSASYIKVNYPQAFSAASSNEKKFYLSANGRSWSVARMFFTSSADQFGDLHFVEKKKRKKMIARCADNKNSAKKKKMIARCKNKNCEKSFFLVVTISRGLKARVIFIYSDSNGILQQDFLNFVLLMIAVACRLSYLKKAVVGMLSDCLAGKNC